MKSEIRIDNRAGCAVIDIEGIIGVPEEAQFALPGQRVATWERFRDVCERIRSIDAPQVAVNIRSGGGDVGDALLIYDALRSLPGRVATRCCGYVASAATVIAQAAAPGCRELAPGTLYLVHRSQSAAEGTADSMDAARELLEKTDERIARIYASHGGRTEEWYRQLMEANGGRGRWLTAEEAVEAGLADRTGASEEDFGVGVGVASGVGAGADVEVGAGADVGADVGVDVGVASGVDVGAGVGSVSAGGVAGDAGGRPDAKDGLPQGEASAVKASAFGTQGETAFMSARPTCTDPVEDPPLGERRPSANEKAYESDLRRLLSLG